MKPGEVQVGHMFLTFTGRLQPRIIVNFPTKRHWRGNSRLEDIRSGLSDLVRTVREHRISSIGIPPLGCGLGGLRWDDVRPMIEQAFAVVPEVDVLLFPPGRAIAPDERVINTPKPPLTPWRASLIKVVSAYAELGCEASHLEAQKLLYLLTSSGVPLQVNFTKGEFGPYDQGMRHALQAMDGHYLLGFADGRRLEPVRLKPGALQEAECFLAHEGHDEQALERIGRVESLIEGFETPCGLELLASVHWVATHEGADTEDKAIRAVHEWNARKAKVMKDAHLRIAWRRLRNLNWIGPIHHEEPSAPSS